MNILICSTSIVSSHENTEFEGSCLSDMCIDFLRIMMRSTTEQFFKTLAFNTFTFIESVSHKLNKETKRVIILLLCDAKLT